jgi:hypothetical protein
MLDKATKLRYGGIYSKAEFNSTYMPQKPSDEAMICLGCTSNKCKGNCKRYKEEYKKLKGERK